MPQVRTSCSISDIYLSDLNNFATIVNGLSVLKLFQILNGEYIFVRSIPTATTNPVRVSSIIPNVGQFVWSEGMLSLKFDMKHTVFFQFLNFMLD